MRVYKFLRYKGYCDVICMGLHPKWHTAQNWTDLMLSGTSCRRYCVWCLWSRARIRFQSVARCCFLSLKSWDVWVLCMSETPFLSPCVISPRGAWANRASEAGVFHEGHSALRFTPSSDQSGFKIVKFPSIVQDLSVYPAFCLMGSWQGFWVRGRALKSFTGMNPACIIVVWYIWDKCTSTGCILLKKITWPISNWE